MGGAGGSGLRNEHGSALLPVLLLMLLFSAAAIGMSIVIRVELIIASRFVQSAEALYAAEAGLAAALAELRDLPDWTPVLDGARPSVRSDGVFSGTKTVPGGGTVLTCCGPQSAASRLTSDTAASPLPARRSVQWQPFLWAAFQSLVPADPPSRLFLVVWVADDEEDGDGNATVDGNGVIIVRAEAIEPGGLRRIVEAYAARRLAAPPAFGEEEDAEPVAGIPAVAIQAWREVR